MIASTEEFISCYFHELQSNLTFFLTFLQGEEICVALQTHINDVMLRRYSKARSTVNGLVQGDFMQSVKPPSVDVYEKRLHELSKTVEESQKNADRVSELIILKIFYVYPCSFLRLL